MTGAVDIIDERITAPSENETDIEVFRNVVGDRVPKVLNQKQSENVATSIFSNDQNIVQSSNALPESIKMNWNKLAASEIGNQLYDKILLFSNREDGWRGAGSRRLSANALSAFLDFWTQIKQNAKRPALALTAEGGLNAQWYKSQKEFVDLTFQPDLKVYFGLFQKDKINEGVNSVENVLRLLALMDGNPLEWKDQ